MAEVLGAFYDGKNICSWTRDSGGSRVWRRERAEFVCYLKQEELSPNAREFTRRSSIVRGVREEGEWLRVMFPRRDVLYRACAPKVKNDLGDYVPGLFEQMGVRTYEADLHPVRRWLLDKKADIAAPRRCYLDIEADSRVPISRKEEQRVLSWTIGDADGDYVTESLAADEDAAEADLLGLLWEELERYDQVVGWYSDEYDHPVLRARSEHCRVRIDTARWIWTDYLPIFRRMNMTVSKSGDEKQSMSLDAVAQAVAGVGKLEGFDRSRTYEAWRDNRELLEQYNARDVWLMPQIEAKVGYLDLHLALSQTCGLIPDTGAANPLRFVDQFIVRLANDRGLHLPTKYGKEEDVDRYPGAYVMTPKPGFVENVHVCDFASMYPSIIRSWNISPETVAGDTRPDPQPSYLAHLPPARKERPEGACESPNGTCFLCVPEGLIPMALGIVLELRKKWTNIKASLPPESPEWVEADRRATAYKQIANSFYGVIGCIFFRLHSLKAVAAIPAAGQWMLREVLAEGEKVNIRGVYGDTDAMWATGVSDDTFRDFVTHINEEHFPAKLKEMGAPKCLLKLEYEKKYELVLLISKKRYAARWAHYKGQPADEKSKPEIKGLEWRRGDAVRLARQLQAEVLDLAMGGGILGPRRSTWCLDPLVYEQVVINWRERILRGELSLADVLQSQRLTKGIDEYVTKTKKDGQRAAQPPHVEVARQLRDRGLSIGEGAKVEYFVVDGGGATLKALPAVDWAGECDRYYLWEDKIYPPTERVLEAAFPAHDWAQYAKVRPSSKVNPNQLGLFGRAALTRA